MAKLNKDELLEAISGLTLIEAAELVEAMEEKYDDQFRVVFEAIKQLIKEDEKPKRKIGF